MTINVTKCSACGMYHPIPGHGLDCADEQQWPNLEALVADNHDHVALERFKDGSDSSSAVTEANPRWVDVYVRPEAC